VTSSPIIATATNASPTTNWRATVQETNMLASLSDPRCLQAREPGVAWAPTQPSG
jgi:hypothetical protein